METNHDLIKKLQADLSLQERNTPNPNKTIAENYNKWIKGT